MLGAAPASVLIHARIIFLLLVASDRVRSCTKLVYDKKGSRPQHMRGRRMGTGLRLQSIESSRGPSRYYAIIGTDLGMAAYNSRKIHEGDWLESIDGTSVFDMDDLRCVLKFDTLAMPF